VQELVGEDQWFCMQGTPGLALAGKKFDGSIKPHFGGDIDENYSISFLGARLKDDPQKRLEKQFVDDERVSFSWFTSFVAMSLIRSRHVV
jgi:hypothetical protein